MPRGGWSRHSLHIFTYSFVSASLILMGLLFSAFAVFDKNSLIGQIWLAGPTTIAVGLVLCGKVIIDCRPMSEDEDVTDGSLLDGILDPEMMAGLASIGPPPDIPYVSPSSASESSSRPTKQESLQEDSPERAPSPKRAAILNSIDAEYAKQKRQGYIIPPTIVTVESPNRREESSSPAAAESPPSDVWSPRILLPSEVLANTRTPTVVFANSHAVGPSTPSPVTNSVTPSHQAQVAECSSSRSERKFSSSLREPRAREPGRGQRRPSSTVLYQGETFVLHEMQYLI